MCGQTSHNGRKDDNIGITYETNRFIITYIFGSMFEVKKTFVIKKYSDDSNIAQLNLYGIGSIILVLFDFQ
jgi:hypothetical protein